MTEADSSSSARYTKPQSGDTWAEDAAQRGQIGTQQLLAVETGPPPPEVQRALKLADGEQVVIRRRLILADNRPVELADSYYPVSIAGGTGLDQPKKIKGGAVRILTELGYPLEDVTETVTARQPSQEEAEILAINPTEVLIILARVSCPADGPPVEYAINRMVASDAEPLVYRMRATTP
jgi:GntR family transcriptional regulator